MASPGPGSEGVWLAALSRLPVTYIFTQDSVGVGEDGPTHQPVETVSGLRVIPNLDVIRPADVEETAAAFAAAFCRVVSLPCFERFERQTAACREEVLPAACTKRSPSKPG